jgi:anion-transporting  ArsA/GET3 family ATPase
MTEVVVCCGVGGTGKTTISAALALKLALAGRRTVVLTIDPARRLADALGLDGLDNEPRTVDLAEGRLHALMLDRKATFDDLVRRLAPDADAATRLLDNRYYRAVSTRLTGSHEYMAIEKLQQLVESGRWDVVVLDTPPSQHAVEFFQAPERLGRLFEQGVLSALTASGGGMLGAATRQAMKVVERIGGGSVLSDIQEFFRLVASISNAVAARNREVHGLLRSARARFYLVTRPTADAREELASFAEVLRDERLRLAGLIVNRVALPPVFDAPLHHARLPAAPEGIAPEAWETTVERLLALPTEFTLLAQQQAQVIDELAHAAGAPPVWRVPDLPLGVRSLEALHGLAPHLP